MAYRSDYRVEKIKRKYGTTAFKRWGTLGGSPIIRDFKAGKLVYRNKKNS